MESILPLQSNQVDHIQAIARDSFPIVWSQKEFLYFLEHPLAVNLGLSAEGGLQAYFIGLLVRGELDIVSIATAKAERQKGKAGRLLKYVLDLPKIEQAYLEVEANNLPAHRLYEKLGFSVTGTRRKYYQHTLDAHLMKWKRS